MILQLPPVYRHGYGSVRAFLAAVAEAGHPASILTLYWPNRDYDLVATGSPTRRTVPPPVVEVEWPPPHLPDKIGRRARELTGVHSAYPIEFMLPDDAWVRCILWDEPVEE